MAEQTETLDYFLLDGADIRLTANGYIVHPGRSFQRSDCLDWRQTYVFASVADLAAWLKTRYKSHG